MIDYKELLTRMYKGWVIRENSWDSELEVYNKSENEAMLEACEGNEVEARLLTLFSFWSNDVQDVGLLLDIRLRRDENEKLIIDSVPPRPSDQHVFDHTDGKWVLAEDEA